MTNPSGESQHPYILKELQNWLASAAKLRQKNATERSPQAESRRMAERILLLREAERLIANILIFQAGYESEHKQLSKLVSELHDASIPGFKDGKHWSLTDEFAPGRGGNFRRALNALLKYLSE